MRGVATPAGWRALIAPLLLIAACSDETGILVAVSGPYVEELEFWVGVERGEDVFLDQEVSGQRHQVQGRNLTASPYEMMLKEPSEGGRALTISVLVLGYVTEEGQKIAKYFAFTFEPQQFIRNEVVRRSMRLRQPSDRSSMSFVGDGCLQVWGVVEEQKEFWLLVASDRDRDCDGFIAGGQPTDCNDRDADIHPQAPEICDGKDNNCDGKFAPASLVCYAPQGDPPVCRQGTRACGDAHGGGLAETCSVDGSDPQMAEAYCWAYEHCAYSADPEGCVAARLEPIVRQCSVPKDPNGTCASSIQLTPPFETPTCEWVLVETGGFSVGLSDGQTAPASSMKICEPLLVLDGGATPDKGTVVLEFFGGDAGSKVVELNLTLTSVPACEGSSAQCN